MKCPACSSSTLVMTERAGIEIDYCPDCRGVWLDRGELDKIIGRSAATSELRAAMPAPATPQREAEGAAGRDRRDWDEDDDDDDDRDRYRFGGDGRRDGKRKRKNLLGELFDF